jgi:hypothetical protein
MKIDLRFTARQLEDLWCQAVVAFVFEEPFHKSDKVFGIDEKTSGYLTYLWESRFWTGADGETLLLASQDKLKAGKIFLKGLGKRDDLKVQTIPDRVGEIGNALLKLKIDDFGAFIPTVESDEFESVDCYLKACRKLVEPYVEKHRDVEDFQLKVVFSLDDVFLKKLNSTAKLLKEDFKTDAEVTVLVDQIQHDR